VIEGLESRTAALGLLDAVLKRHLLLDDAFDNDSLTAKLEPRDRAFVRLLVAETLRRLGQIDALIERCLDKPLPPKARRVQDILRLGAVQMFFLETAPHAAVSTAVDLVKSTALAGYGKLINAVLRRLDREGRQWIGGQNAGQLNTPEWLWRAWTKDYGETTAIAIAEAHLHSAPTDLCAASDPDGWAQRLGGSLLPMGAIRLPNPGDITALEGFHQGAWWVQDVAAQIPVRLLGDIKGQRVLDLCAAPGGKTLQMAAAGAIVTALDLSPRRLERVQQNLDRMKLSAEIIAADGAKWEPPQLFPLILLDAPCSATGTLRRHPDGLHLKNSDDVMRLTLVQDRLLAAALKMLAPGGTLVYCVCSLERAEGEGRIEALLAGSPDYARLPITAEELDGMGEWVTARGDLRTLPFHLADKGGMDAFFAARIQRM
jgi:16S rRNA (cytosine967-C5)-methyltransferase